MNIEQTHPIDPTPRESEESLRIAFAVEGLRFIAKGGLGAVFVGEDSVLHRRVAVKFMHPHLAADSLSRERFALESEITARLEHPGVIPLYGVGLSGQGHPFYAMRFIDGVSLDDAIEKYFNPPAGDSQTELSKSPQGSVEFHRLLACFVSVCQTIAYAHNRGIVHRDIKPANVMLGKYGETIVVDWGLAVTVDRDERFKQSGEKTLLPRRGDSSGSSGQGAGTPAYMSPEQASELAPTPASDIYSLGATLFKILCGQPPVEAQSLTEIRQKIIDGRLLSARQLRPSIPRPLEAICRKAMALRPTDRYGTAQELARDVERFLADEPVSAYREPALSKLSRLARQHRLATQAAVAGLAACLLISGAATIALSAYASKESLARKAAEETKSLAEKLRRENLAASAQFLAKSISQEIDLRWRVLEAEAASPRVRELVRNFNATFPTGSKPERAKLSELQQWLDKRYIAHNSAVKTSSWILNSLSGTQIARVPEAASIGQNFAHRDYFSGLGRDLDPNQANYTPPAPLLDRIVHLSAAFESANTNTLMVAFSAPVWSDGPENLDRLRIGVLGMTVELGDFGIGMNAWLIDTRENSFSNRRGLILHHRNLGLHGRKDRLPYVSDELLELASQLRSSATRPGGTGQQLALAKVVEALDPIDEKSKLVAIAPVTIAGRPSSIADSGWVVAVTESDE